MARYVEGRDRQQVTLLPECLEDYIAEDNPLGSSTGAKAKIVREVLGKPKSKHDSLRREQLPVWFGAVRQLGHKFELVLLNTAKARYLFSSAPSSLLLSCSRAFASAIRVNLTILRRQFWPIITIRP